MKNIRRFLEKSLDEAIEDLRYYDTRGDVASADIYEAQACKFKEQLKLFDEIEKSGEGNLLSFNADGTFGLWCVRVPEGGEQIVETYNVDLDFENFEELLEVSDCIDMTDLFDLSAIAHLVVVTDDIQKECTRRDVYYFVSNEALESVVVLDAEPNRAAGQRLSLKEKIDAAQIQAQTQSSVPEHRELKNVKERLTK